MIPQNTLAPQPKKSNTAIFVILGVIALILVFGALIFIMKKTNIRSDATPVITAQTSQVPTMSIQNQSTVNPTTPALPPGNNDTQLNQDMQTVNNSISSSDAKLNGVNQGLNDQSVNLTE